MKKLIFSLIALMTAMVMNGQVKQTYLTLNNGVQMPQFGLGVYSIPDFIRPPSQGSTFFVLILLCHFNHSASF